MVRAGLGAIVGNGASSTQRLETAADKFFQDGKSRRRSGDTTEI